MTIFEERTLTKEQDYTVECIASGEDTGVQAPAGSGKTFTLQAAAYIMQERRGFYIAFNKAISESAKQKFRNNVDCRTGHSIAFGQCGWAFKDRISKITGTLIAKSMFIGETSMFPTPASKGYIILDTIRRFCYSADKTIQEKHVPLIKGPYSEEHMPEIRKDIIPWAKNIWNDMSDKEGKLPITHDTYVKMWALSNPTIKKDFILFDEAQDANPVMLDVINRQDHAQKIFVGDKFQQIYCQPKGTMISVPDQTGRIALIEDRCSYGNCHRHRDHKDTGLCHGHHKQNQKGEELKHIPSKPRNIKIRQVPIEKILKDTRVVTGTYDKMYRHGRKVTSVSKFLFHGKLVVVSTGTLTSKYIPKHQCIVRIGDSLKGKYIVYLMKQGQKYRIGKSPYFYNSQGNMFGLGLRGTGEKASAAWILSIHETSGEALMYEAIYQTKFSIPGMRFIPGDRDVINTHLFWSIIGDNSAMGEKCLCFFDLLKEFPLWTSGRTNPVGTRRPFVTAASNVHSGMMMLPLGRELRNRANGIPKDIWEKIEVTSEYYKGEVYSLEIDDHHTYYGDKLLTHNSWRGAINAMDRLNVAHSTYITQSFRFGQEIADMANQILTGYMPPEKAPPPIKGLESKPGIVTLDTIEDPDVIICRTNAGVISNVFKYLEKDVKVYVQGGVQQMMLMLKGAEDLQEGKRTYAPDLALFQNWQEVIECSETESGMELRSFVKMIKEYGIPKLIEGLSATALYAGGAKLTLTTAHKAKGLEWEKVGLYGDFMTPAEDKKLPQEEINLLYVAATRALNTLDISMCTACHPETIYEAKNSFRNCVESKSYIRKISKDTDFYGR